MHRREGDDIWFIISDEIWYLFEMMDGCICLDT